MRAVVIGLDTASDRWHAVVRGDGGRWPYQTKIKHKDADVRRVTLAREFGSFLQIQLSIRSRGERLHVFCEEPIAPRDGRGRQNPKTTRLLSLLAGALWDRHVDLDIFWHWVDISSWQSMVGAAHGTTPERKAKIRAWAIENLDAPPDDWDEDHYDAACIGEYGDRLLQGSTIS